MVAETDKVYTRPDGPGMLLLDQATIEHVRRALKLIQQVPAEDIEGDAFGRIYEYFLGTFAMSEGQKGGEFFTPLALTHRGNH